MWPYADLDASSAGRDDFRAALAAAARWFFSEAAGHPGPVSLVRRLAAHYDDYAIAAILAKQRRRTATGLAWTRTKVKELRVSRGIRGYRWRE